MKKFTLIIAFVAVAFGFTNAQTTFVTAPTNVTTTQLRAPNGFNTHAFLRASSLVLTAELATIPAATTLTSIGFTTTAGADMAVSGTMTVYLQNSGDATFLKGTTWSTIITGMTSAYVGTYTVPANATTIDLNLTTPFVYTGGSIYVAYDFASAGPFASTTPATYGANNTLASGCVSASSSSVVPTTLGTTSFRPSFRFGFLNTITNDMAVESINTLGSVAQILGLPVPISAIVKNNSNTTLTNVVVSANMIGANAYSNNQTVASIASGATATVNFALWTPLTMGANTLNVTVPVDQNNTNNAKGFKNMVTCNTSGNNENQPIGYNYLGFHYYLKYYK